MELWVCFPVQKYSGSEDNRDGSIIQRFQEASINKTAPFPLHRYNGGAFNV
jgi:hypothetical protein